MARAPLQVLVIPFRRTAPDAFEYAVFHRADGSMWQFLSGGAEDSESAWEAALREASEEAAVPSTCPWTALQATASVPRAAFPTATHWPADLFVVPERAFAVDLTGHAIAISAEHDEVRWLPFAEANRLLTWDSNRVALGELQARLNTSQRSAASSAALTPPVDLPATIRAARVGDERRLAMLNGLAQAEHVANRPDHFPPIGVDEMTESFRAHLLHASAQIWLAEAAGTAVGYVLSVINERPANLYCRSRRWCEIEQIAVDPRFRRRGLATALIQQAVVAAKQHGIDDVELCIWSFNEASRRTFAKFGFVLKYARWELPRERFSSGSDQSLRGR